MNKTIKADLYRYTGTDYSIGKLVKCLRIPGFRFTYLLRNSNRYKKYSLPGLFFRVLLRHYSFKYGYQIASETCIGDGFFIGHFGNIVINTEAVIGRNCNIAPGVTIGQANRGKLAGVPIIGNKVWMGTNCVIVGKITLGKNVLIAPGAFVNFDVPDNSIVVGNPGKIILNPNATQNYITKTWE